MSLPPPTELILNDGTSVWFTRSTNGDYMVTQMKLSTKLAASLTMETRGLIRLFPESIRLSGAGHSFVPTEGGPIQVDIEKDDEVQPEKIFVGSIRKIEPLHP